jgi:hypothetical protein
MKSLKTTLAVFITALVAAAVAAPTADAYLHVENAANHCRQQTFAHAQTWPGFAGTPIGYGPTAYHRYADNDVLVRVRFQQPGYTPYFVWYNCRIQGSSTTYQSPNWQYVAASFFLGWAAPNYVVNTSLVPNWPYRLHPFQDPETGTIW